MPTAIGAVTTGTVLAARRPYVLGWERVIDLDPEVTPFLTILSKTKRESVDDVKIQWHEYTRLPEYTLINNAGVAAADAVAGTVTTITVDSATGAYFRAGHIIRNMRTGELMLVGTPAANTLAVTRQYGYDSGNSCGTAAATLNDNDPLVIIGNVVDEGSTAVTPLDATEDEKFNYLQIMRQDISLTNSEAGTKLRTESNDRVYRRRHALALLKIELERSLIWGERKLVTSTKRIAGGLLFYIGSATDMNGTMTEYDFDCALETLFMHSSDGPYSGTKLALCGPRPLTVIAHYAKEKVRLNEEKSKQYGLNITSYHSSCGGTLDLVLHPLFKSYSNGTTSYGLQNSMVIVDPNEVKFCYGPNANGINRDLTLIADTQAPGTDAKQDEWITECGIIVGHGGTGGVHGYFSNITG